jgi:peptidyl-prolyl cis-trans isomerase D
MLSVLRRNRNSPIVVIVLGIVVLLMIGFGISYQGPDQARYAAKVNGSIISEAEFSATYANEYGRQQQLNPSYDAAAAERDGLRKRVLDQMITTRLLAQRARKMGLAVDDEALREAIVSKPYFQVDGQFSRDQYERVLNAIGQPDRQYEESERERLLADKLTAVFQGVGVSEAEVRKAYDLQNAKRDFEFVKVPKAAFTADIGTVTPADVEAWAAAQPDVDEQVAEFYRKNKSTRYDVPKQACIQQIMVRVDDSTPPKLKTQKRQKLKEALTKLNQGVSFDAVAAEMSEDASRQTGGRMPCFSAGEGLAPIEEQAFSMEVGELSPVITTGFGYHIIKVNEFKEPIRLKREDVEDEIRRELAAKSRAEKGAQELVERLLAAAKDAESLQAALAGFESEVPLQAERTGPIAVNRQYLPQFGLAPDVSRVGWSLTLESPLSTEAIETDDAFVALRLTRILEPDRTQFDAQKSNLENMLQTTKMNDIFPDWQAALQEGADIEVNQRILSYGT